MSVWSKLFKSMIRSLFVWYEPHEKSKPNIFNGCCAWRWSDSVTQGGVKYLGVLLSDKYGTLSSQWKAHITKISTKASQRFNFLRRNLRGCPYKLRELGYISLVRSSLEYCEAIWDTTIKDEADRLEMIQHCTARWACGARRIISVTALLWNLNWQALADRRCNQRLTLFYKILNKYMNIPPKSVNTTRSSSRTRKKHRDILNREWRRDKHSPFWKGTICRTILIWNSLDCTVAEADSQKSLSLWRLMCA